MAKPRVLLLDEPSMGLAPIVVQEIFRTLVGINRTGLTILLVEQSAAAAESLNQQAARLAQVVGAFKIDASSAAAVETASPASYAPAPSPSVRPVPAPVAPAAQRKLKSAPPPRKADPSPPAAPALPKPVRAQAEDDSAEWVSF
jgi:ABC-type antimicrobial peptide transport system ATPase subunit